MLVVAFATMKGGPGKTTVLFNVAGVLAEEKKVCVIDLDPQCNLSGACGVKQNLDWRKLIKKIPVKIAPSSRDIFEGSDVSPDALVVKQPIDGLPNLDVIPGNMLMTATEFNLVNRPAREAVLRNYLEDHANFFEQYDYVLLDTNPSMGVINQNAFTAADSIVLVTDIGEDGIEGAGIFLYLWGSVCRGLRKEPNIEALVINRASRTIKLTDELYEYCADDEFFGDLLVKDMIYEKVVYKEARMDHTPVNLMKNGKEATEDIRKVVNELFERGVF